MADTDTYIALHKFGLGARMGEAETVSADPAGWLQAQLTDVSSTLDEYNLPSSKDGIALYFDYEEARRLEQEGDTASQSASVNKKDRFSAFIQDIDRMKTTQVLLKSSSLSGPSFTNARSEFSNTREQSKSKPAATKTADELYAEMIGMFYDEVDVRTRHAIITPAGFREALVRFWSDHFNVFALKSLILIPSAATLEREAIRPFVTGKFEDMLMAVQTHPAMQIYLDNWYSAGPNSWVGQTYGLGLNENLAREILELHTLGVNGGYKQEDVIALAEAITGWTVANPQIQETLIGLFVFEPLFHEPGSVTVMGKTYPQTGLQQGLEILKDLAVHPSTATFLAGKLARHFHSDTPPQSLIDRLEAAFNDSGGDLLVVSDALVTSPEMWDGQFLKLRNSEEFAIGMLRGLDFNSLTPEQSIWIFSTVAQIPYFEPSPAGWPKTEASWASAATFSARADIAAFIGGFIEEYPEPSTLASDLLGNMLGSISEYEISNADTVEEGYALTFMAPEFQRR